MATKAPAKKTAPKKAPAKKTTAKKAAPKKVAAAKPAAKKVVAKKAVPAKKVAAKKTPVKKASVKTTVAKKVVPKKPVAKKATAKKSAAEKSAAEKSAAKKPASVKAVAKPKATKTVAKPAVKKSSPKKAAKPSTAKRTVKATSGKVVEKNKTSNKSTTKDVKTKAGTGSAKSAKSSHSVQTKMAGARKKVPLKQRRKNIHKTGQRTVTFRIQRGVTVNGHYQSHEEEFKVKFDDSTTILQALESIKAEQDGSLTFRRSCRASICGSCGMFVNGRSRLVCRTKVRDIVDGNPVKNRPGAEVVEVGPQKNQPVLKDLAVDIGEFYQKVEKITPYVQEGAETQTQVDKTSFEQVNMVSNCIMCGCCYSDCEEMAVSKGYLGPAALAKAFRFVSDPREGRKTERLAKLSKKDGIWDCTRCGMCVDSCPKGVAPMEAIVKLRTRAIDAGITNNRGAKHAMAFKKDIETTGMLNEPMLVLKTCGVAGTIAQIGNALHLATKGKVPSPLPHKVHGVEEIKAIFDALEENPIDVETKQEDNGPGAG